MTPEELQEVVAAVIASLKTNGKTIMQLTEVTTVTDNDYFEIHGGRRVKYQYLYEELLSETQDIIDEYKTDLGDRIDDLEDDLTTGLAAKMDFHDASWLENNSVGNLYYDELVAAIQAGKLVMTDGVPVVFSQILDSGNTVRAFTLKGKNLTKYEAVKGTSSATVTRTTITLMDNSDASDISSSLASLLDAIQALQGNDYAQDQAIASHTTQITALGNQKANASDVYTKGQTDTLLGGKVSTSDVHTINGQDVLQYDVFTSYVEVLTMSNNVVTGELSFAELSQMIDMGITVSLLFRNEIYQQCYSSDSDLKWSCGIKQLSLSNGDVWTYDAEHLEVPADNVIFEGINDQYIIVGESSVATCLDELYHTNVLFEQTRLPEVYLTQDQYNAMADAGTLDANTKYFIYEE